MDVSINACIKVTEKYNKIIQREVYDNEIIVNSVKDI